MPAHVPPEGVPSPSAGEKQQQGGSCSQQGCGSGDGGCGSSSSAGGDGQRAAAALEAAAGESTAQPPPGAVCMKCRKQPAELVARGREPLCHPCLHEQLLSKVRNAVRMHALISPGDTLGLAYSGGLASAALLHFLCELRNPRTDRPARGKVSFSLHIIHIDESAALGRPQAEQQGALARLAEAAGGYCGEGVQYHCVPLEDAFADAADTAAATAAIGPDSAEQQKQQQQQQQQQQQARRQRLQALLAAVPDATGRDDLARHLRTHLLLRTAAALGCARLARGDCATALAAHIVAASAKGCGYSLPGDIHLVDARHGAALPSTFAPLREVSARELGMFCCHSGLPVPLPLPEAAPPVGTVGLGAGGQGREAKQNINALAAAFIAGMETHNPGSVPNILNTVSKLEAFPWNEPGLVSAAAAAAPPGHQQQQRRRRRQDNGAPAAAAAAAAEAAVGDGLAEADARGPQQHMSAVLCPICLAPLADDELPGGSARGESDAAGHTSGGSGAIGEAVAAGCCLSCSAQILGNGAGGSATAAAAGSEQSAAVAAALPAAVQQRMAALAAAGARVGAPAAPTADSIERLRAQIAEFLLE